MSAAIERPPLLTVDGVSKGYGSGSAHRPVIRSVDLTIAAGEKVSLVGPSGSGKSTLLSLIAGLIRPDTVTLSVNEPDPTTIVGDAVVAIDGTA